MLNFSSFFNRSIAWLCISSFIVLSAPFAYAQTMPQVDLLSAAYAQPKTLRVTYKANSNGTSDLQFALYMSLIDSKSNRIVYVTVSKNVAESKTATASLSLALTDDGFATMRQHIQEAAKIELTLQAEQNSGTFRDPTTDREARDSLTIPVTTTMKQDLSSQTDSDTKVEGKNPAGTLPDQNEQIAAKNDNTAASVATVFEPKLGYETFYKLLPPGRYKTPVDLLNALFYSILLLRAFLILLGLMLAGILFMMAGGDPEREKKAKTYLKWVIITMLILLLFVIMTEVLRSFLTDFINQASVKVP